MRSGARMAGLLVALVTSARALVAQGPADTVRLTLDDAVRRSLELGEEVRVARAQVGDARGQVREATAAALPEVRGAVVYTPKARVLLTDIPREALEGMRSSSEPYAQLLARNARERYGATWGISETGAAGPTGNGYGDSAGHTCVAVAGPVEAVLTIETGESDRQANMLAFAMASLSLLQRALAAVEAA